MSGVKLRFGKRWRSGGSGAAEIKPAHVRDFIDLVVGAENLTARLREECIFTWLADVLEGAAALYQDHTRKIIIPFPEAPWELALCSLGPDALGLSLYSIAPGGEVAALDRVMSHEDMAQALQEAAQALLDDLARVAPQQVEDPLAQRIARAAQALQAAWEAPRGGSQDAPSVAPDWFEHRQPMGAAELLCRMDLGRAALLQYQGEHPFDLHALLARGELWLEHDSGVVRLDEGYPLQSLRRLLRDALGLQGAAQATPGAQIQRRGEQLIFSRPGSRGWGRRHGLRALEREGERKSLGLQLGEGELEQALSSLTWALSQALQRRNPALGRETRLGDLKLEAERLGDAQCCAPAAQPGGEPSALRVQPSPQGQPSGFRFGLTGVHKLVYRRLWSLPLEGPAEYLTRGDDLLVVDLQGATSVDASSGEVRWCMPEVESLHLCGQAMLANHESGRVARLDPDSGLPQWWHQPSGGYNVWGAAHFAQEGEGLLLLATRGGLEALDEQGQLRWRQDWQHKPPRRVEFWEDLAIAALEDGTLCAVEAHSGQPRWTARLTGQPRWMERSGDLLLTGARARGLPRTHITARELSTGRLLWETQTEGTPQYAPVSWGDALAWTFAARGACGVQVVERSTGQPMWSRRYRSAGTCGPTGPTLCAGALCWKNDNGEVYAHNPQTGRARWRSRVCPQGEALWSNLPLEVHAGALWAAGDWLYIIDPCDGQVLHRLDSLPPHPNQVCVGPQLQLLVGADQEEVGESALDAWGVEGFLAVVPRAGL